MSGGGAEEIASTFATRQQEWFALQPPLNDVVAYLATKRSETAQPGQSQDADDDDFLLSAKMRPVSTLDTEQKPVGPIADLYCGLRGVHMQTSYRGNGQPEDVKEVYIMGLQATLLPAGVSSNSSDYPCEHSCKLLSVNWPLLEPFLLPSLHRQQDSSSSTSTTEPAPFPALTYAEYKRLRSDPSMMDRIHYSYNILLHYLGWRMHCQETGELDRHRYWKERYATLEGQLLGKLPNDHVGGYNVITPLIRMLAEFRLLVFAKNLLKYVLEEMVNGRLLFLRAAWRDAWIPFLASCKEESSELNARIKKDLDRMVRRYDKLDESDSD